MVQSELYAKLILPYFFVDRMKFVSRANHMRSCPIRTRWDHECLVCCHMHHLMTFPSVNQSLRNVTDKLHIPKIVYVSHICNIQKFV